MQRKVDRIVRECRLTNEKFTDPDFDLEGDNGVRNCLCGLLIPEPDIGDITVSAGSLSNALNTLLGSKILGPNASVTMDLTALQNALKNSVGENETDQECLGSVHRVDYIFEEPSFLVDGFSSSDVQQGGNGDCWWVAAVATLCSMSDLMDKICMAQKADCGVYGFVFYRDGEWISTVIDDNLYLL